MHTGPLQLQSRAENLTPTDLPARLIPQAAFAGSSLEARGHGPSAITPNISVQLEVGRRLAKLGLSGFKVWVNGPLTGVRPRGGSCGSAQLAIPAADSANFQLELEIVNVTQHSLPNDYSSYAMTSVTRKACPRTGRCNFGRMRLQPLPLKPSVP